MKKIKILFWLVVVIFFGLVVYSNMAFFAKEQTFVLDLHWVKYHLPAVLLGVVFLGSFLAGFLLCGYFNLKGRFRASREIRLLKDLASKQEQAIASLKSNLAASPAAEHRTMAEPEADVSPAS